MKSREELRKEFSKPKFQKMLAREKGTVCAGCGEMDSIEYHHIVPLVLGGDNRLSNIIPLCTCCHGKIHGMAMTSLSRVCRKGGRKKREAPEGYKVATLMYAKGKMSEKDLKERFGLSDGSRISSQWWFKKALEEYGIVSYKNVVGRRSAKDGLVSRLWFEDGGYMEVYKDVMLKGMYDEMYYPNKYTKEEVAKIKKVKRTCRPDKEINQRSINTYH